jgi:hypothetical protein
MLRACFLLLAIVVLVIMSETLAVMAGCFWLIVIESREPLGACANQGAMIRDILSEVLTAVLALIAASRGG